MHILFVWICYIICIIGIIINKNQLLISFNYFIIIILIFTIIFVFVTIIMLINNKKYNKKQNNPLLKIYLDGKLKCFTHNQEYASYRFNELYNFYYDSNQLENHSIELKIQKR